MAVSPGSICLVLTPSGDPGEAADLERVFGRGIAPGLAAAGLKALREDAASLRTPLGRPLFERVVLSDRVVADLTHASADLVYALGVRHGLRPDATVCLLAEGHPAPLNPALAPALRYAHDDAGLAQLGPALADRLGALAGSPGPQASDAGLVGSLVGGGGPAIARLKTDEFRDRVDYAPDLRRRLAAARSQSDSAALHRIEASLGALEDVEAGALIDLMLSYRATSDWDAVVALCDAMPPVLQRTVLVREQRAFALNRRGERAAAAELLGAVLAEHGPSSETCGLLGRVHKDRWREALTSDPAAAAAHLERAIAAYLRGFEADWRDAYPGINALTLLDIQGAPASLTRRDALLPVVRYAVDRRLDGQDPDYWDHATLLELAVLARDEAAARRHLRAALAVAREPWEPESTADNLRLVRTARAERDAAEPWLDDVIAELAARRS
ncbi:MAG: TRAFs-binding domain-containing protein [Myxococcota bacterium]